MKRLLSVILACLLLSSGLCLPAYAAGTSVSASAGASSSAAASVKISLDTLETLWRAKGPGFLQINSNLAVAKETYNKLDDTMDDLNKLPLELVDMSTYNTVSNSRDQAKCSYDVLTAQYDQNVQNGILAVKALFLTCWQDQLDLDSAQQNLSAKKARLSNYEAALAKGYISQSTYDSMKDAVNSLTSAVGGLSTKLLSDQLTLKTKLGLALDGETTFTYPSFTADDITKLLSVDFQTDLAGVVEKSSTVKALQITYQSMKSSSYANSSQKQAAEQNLTSAKASVQTSLTLLHSALATQGTDLQASLSSLSLETEKLSKTQGLYDRGLSSATALSDAKLEYAAMLASVQKKEAGVYGAYLSYENAAAGY